MPLTTSSELLADAQKKRYAVPAFNVENMEMVLAVIGAAEELRSPVIIQTTPSTIAYACPELYQAMISVVAGQSKMPAAIHLDHGDSFDLCKRALMAGYTSLMIDGSKLPFDENISLTKKVVELASAHAVPVEAELGTVGGKEDSHVIAAQDVLFTDPSQAAEFVERTGISSLAVAIGTAHGFYKGIPVLEMERLKEIRSRVNVPLVLHGASGIPAEMLTESIGLGICKINFATELRVAFTNGIRPIVADQAIYDPKKYGKAGIMSVLKLAWEKIYICGSANRYK